MGLPYSYRHTDCDLTDRPCQLQMRDDGDERMMYRRRLQYDKLGNLERFVENVGTKTHETVYIYNRDNRVTALTYDGDVQKVSYTTGTLGQLIRVDGPHENATWVYCYEDSGSTYIRSLRTTDTLGTVVQRMVNLV